MHSQTPAMGGLLELRRGLCAPGTTNKVPLSWPKDKLCFAKWIREDSWAEGSTRGGPGPSVSRPELLQHSTSPGDEDTHGRRL